MKVCSKCKEEKDKSEFSKAKNRPDGLYNYCRKCKSDEDKKYRNKPGFKIRKNENERKRRNNNIDHYRKYNRDRARWEWENNPKAKQRDKKWKRNNQDKIKVYSKKVVDELRDVYVRGNLLRDGFTRDQLIQMPEILEAKKSIIKIKRHVKQNKH